MNAFMANFKKLGGQVIPGTIRSYEHKRFRPLFSDDK